MENQRKNMLGSVVIPPEVTADIRGNVKDIKDFTQKVQEYISQNTTSLLDAILAGAIALEASDVHLEPQSDQIRLRLRIDGVLQDATAIDSNVYHNLLNRLKLLSKLKLNITDRPQDGRFSISQEEESVEVRTSSLPAEYGESVVMRILNPKNLMALESLGLRKDLYEIFAKEIKKPNGMIIISGPTGAGKTTTLYAFLMKMQTPEIKIITIEDPIEYHLKGISQTQVAQEGEFENAGTEEALRPHHQVYDFSSGLRSIVRQDPDIILVGEIRDLETAKISLQAALTGHMVLSTVHTNDSASTIARLIDLGADVSSVANAVSMVVGQRLVRTTCKECSSLKTPSQEELAEITNGLKNLPKNVEIPNNLENVKIPNAKEGGCKACNFTGYKGRKSLYEIFLVDGAMEKFILSGPTVAEIKEKAVKNGMVTVYQSGLIEVVFGHTTLDEVKRVVEADE